MPSLVTAFGQSFADRHRVNDAHLATLRQAWAGGALPGDNQLCLAAGAESKTARFAIHLLKRADEVTVLLEGASTRHCLGAMADSFATSAAPVMQPSAKHRNIAAEFGQNRQKSISRSVLP
jgi:hypothetical protein